MCVTGVIQNFECVIRFVRFMFPAWSRWGTYRRLLCQEGQSSNLGLRHGVGQVARTCNIPHVKCSLYVSSVSYKKVSTQKPEVERCQLIRASPLDNMSENACSC
jgi:hypothetical protein